MWQNGKFLERGKPLDVNTNKTEGIGNFNTRKKMTKVGNAAEEAI